MAAKQAGSRPELAVARLGQCSAVHPERTATVVVSIPAMENAQETFKRMMREQIAPKLRALGFKGSGQKFVLTSDSHWALVGFQRSAWGSSAEGRFTINLTAVSKSAWEQSRAEHPHRGSMPQANAFEGAPAWAARIGRLMPDSRDQWWTVSAGARTDDVAAEVIDAVESYALPELRRQIEGSPAARPPLWMRAE